MSLYGPVLLSVCVLFFTWLLYRVWVQRDAARSEVRRDARDVELTRRMRAIAHDLDNLLQIVTARVDAAPRPSDPRLAEALDEIERAATIATKLVDAARGRSSPDDRGGSAEPMVRLVVGLLRREDGSPIDLRVRGDLPHDGSDADAFRVVQNLLLNAVREARQIDGGRVQVELADDGLTIVNPIRDPAALGDEIWEEGTTSAGSTGLGLPTARALAARIGWTVRHQVHQDTVTFVVSGATSEPCSSR